MGNEEKEASWGSAPAKPGRERAMRRLGEFGTNSARNVATRKDPAFRSSEIFLEPRLKTAADRILLGWKSKSEIHRTRGLIGLRPFGCILNP